MKLKTLKDIPMPKDEYEATLSRDDLKAEAVKWLKEKDRDWYKNFKEFHNITEEDLQ